MKKDAGSFPAGKHTLRFMPQSDRYTGQLTQWARVIRGEMAAPYTRGHDELVHEVTLAASGDINWKKRR